MKLFACKAKPRHHRAMADIINLRRARKAREREAEQKRADASRAEHGRSKAERQAAKTEASRANRLLDGARRENEDES